MAGYKNYAKMSIQTADPRAVIVLLYEGCINFLNQAVVALENGDRMAMSLHVTKAQRIIHHLWSALDFEKGDEIAQNLSRLYTYMRDTLSIASIHCDAGKISEVINLIRPLLQAWNQVAKDPSANAALDNLRANVPGPSSPNGENASPADPQPDLSVPPATQTDVGAEDFFPSSVKSPSAAYGKRNGAFSRLTGAAVLARSSQSLSESV